MHLCALGPVGVSRQMGMRGAFGRRGRVVGHTVGAFLGGECITRDYMIVSVSPSLALQLEADSDRRVLGVSSIRDLCRAAYTSLPPLV
jgi:hypothetical protein